MLSECTTILAVVQQHLLRAQQRMKIHADKKRSERLFQVRGPRLPSSPAVRAILAGAVLTPQALLQVFWAFQDPIQGGRCGVQA